MDSDIMVECPCAGISSFDTNYDVDVIALALEDKITDWLPLPSCDPRECSYMSSYASSVLHLPYFYRCITYFLGIRWVLTNCRVSPSDPSVSWYDPDTPLSPHSEFFDSLDPQRLPNTILNISPFSDGIISLRALEDIPVGSPIRISPVFEISDTTDTKLDLIEELEDVVQHLCPKLLDSFLIRWGTRSTMESVCILQNIYCILLRTLTEDNLGATNAFYALCVDLISKDNPCPSEMIPCFSLDNEHVEKAMDRFSVRLESGILDSEHVLETLTKNV
jgi:hypothetical protein